MTRLADAAVHHLKIHTGTTHHIATNRSSSHVITYSRWSISSHETFRCVTITYTPTHPNKTVWTAAILGLSKEVDTEVCDHPSHKITHHILQLWLYIKKQVDIHKQWDNNAAKGGSITTKMIILSHHRTYLSS